MAGAPSLGVNLAYNPFGKSRRQPDEPAPRTDGFSDDGLSYEVIRDIDKLTAQALADFDARAKNQRGFWEGLDEYNRRVSSAPQILAAELAAINGTQNKQPFQPRTFEMGNQIVQEDPVTGQYNVAFTAPPPEPKP